MLNKGVAKSDSTRELLNRNTADLTELISADDSRDDGDDSVSEWSDDVQSLDGSTEDAAFTNLEVDEGDSTSRPTSGNGAMEAIDVLVELVFQLVTSFCLEEFEDGQPGSSLVVYFSGILRFTLDGTTFRRARDYTTYLSALIHQQQLLCLEYALPSRAYLHLG